MSPKEKTKTGALPSGRSKESERQKEVERQKEIERLEKDVEELRHLAGNEDADAELGRIREQVGELRREFYTHLGPWQRAQIARHQQRPYTLDFIGLLFTDFYRAARGPRLCRRQGDHHGIGQISWAARGHHRTSKRP